MKIVQITATGDGYNSEQIIYGLGDDNKMYRWRNDKNDWEPLGNPFADDKPVPLDEIPF